MRLFLIPILFLILASFSVPHLASAQAGCTEDAAGNFYCPDAGTVSTGNTVQTQSTGNTTGGVALMNPLQGGTNLESFLKTILSFVIRIGAIIVVLMLVYVGYLFVVAQGSDSKLTEARKALLWTIIGALILLGAQAIAIGLESTVRALSAGS